MSCTAQSLINTAYANGYAGLSEADLQACILAAACLAGGGSGTGGVVTGSGAPAAPPAAGTGIYIDNSNPANPGLWVYPTGGPWNNIIAGGP